MVSAAARHVGLDPEKDMTILQLGTGSETVSALENGRIAAAAITHRYALPFLEKGWPLLVDLSTTDLVYPSSCVASSRSYVKSEPRLAENFLRAYVAGIQLIRSDYSVAERSLAKWLRERDMVLVRKTVEAYAKLFKSVPNVPDKGLENVIRDLQGRRNVPKEFVGRYDLFRDSGPLERALGK